MRLKIAQVTTTDTALRYLLRDQIHALECLGHDVICVSQQGRWSRELREEGFKVVHVPMERELAPVHDVRTFTHLRQLFTRLAIDVVHSHTPKAGLLAPFAARAARVPVILHTVHGFLFHDQQPLSAWIPGWVAERTTSAACDLLLMQSREDVAAAERFRIARREQVRYIGNGIDVSAFRAAMPQAERDARRAAFGFSPFHLVIGTVARFVREKGYLELIEAAKKIITRWPQARFLFVAPLESDQRDALSPSVLDPLIHRGILRRLDWTCNLSKIYPLFDLFVLPTHREGIPRACLEASAAGLSTIATDIRGCREVITHGESGVLVPCGDVRLLVAAMEHLIAAPELLRVAMGERARQRCLRDFNANAVIERLCAVYDEVTHLMARRKLRMPAPARKVSPVTANPFPDAFPILGEPGPETRRTADSLDRSAAENVSSNA